MGFSPFIVHYSLNLPATWSLNFGYGVTSPQQNPGHSSNCCTMYGHQFRRRCVDEPGWGCDSDVTVTTIGGHYPVYR
jgi:hypothetical protein